MAETLRIVFSLHKKSRRQPPIMVLRNSAPLSAALLQLLDRYSRKAKQAMLTPSQQTMDRLLRAVYE